MKSIRHRILYFTLLPFLAVYIALLGFIVYEVYNIQTRETWRYLKNMALYNEVNLRKCYETIELSVQITAVELERIDSHDPAAREIGENIITARFHNPYVICAWLVFEPNAFDGKDSLYIGEYPGAPSGRYLRSFIRNGASWKLIGDMTEEALEDREKSYFYFIPLEAGAFFTDLGSSYTPYWDYGNGPVSSFRVVKPIFRNGKIIGCVGLDAALNEETLGGKIYPNSVSAIFLSNGRLGYSLDFEKVNKTPEDLEFDNSAYITEHLRNETTDFSITGYSGLSGDKSLNYFHPVNINGEYIFIYNSIPERDVWLLAIPVLLPVASAFLISLIVFAVIFMYLTRDIAFPLRKLTEACENIASGNLEMNISVVNTKDEMGMISRSLLRMAEQFRANNLLQERYHDRFKMILNIHYALFRSNTLNDAFSAALTEISEYLEVYKGSLVYSVRDTPIIAAVYPSPEAETEEENNEFFAHGQVVQLLENKKLFTINGKALESAHLSFLDFSTKAICILPLRTSDVLHGYIILEGKKQETIVHDDTTLLFLSDALSYVVNCRIDWEQEIDKTGEQSEKEFPVSKKIYSEELFMAEDEDAFLEKAKNIQNLNVDKGIFLIGGEKKKYTELLMITIKVISESILKMRSFYSENLDAFAIEVHGIKAALYNIGAEILGEEAKQLEYAAKSDDARYCTENYPLFEEKLRAFSRNLAMLFPRQERNSQKGEVPVLKEALVKAREACNAFDVSAVTSLLTPLSSLTWDDEVIQTNLQNIISDMENLEYEGMASKISDLIEFLGNGEK